MNRKEHVGVPDTVDQLWSQRSRGHKDRLSFVVEMDMTRGNGAVSDEKVSELCGEHGLNARAVAVQLREEAADLRERDIQASENLLAAIKEPVLMLQQANTRLVVSTLEAHQLAERLETAHVQLESAKCLAENSSLAKSQFLSSMSHELRTPLNAILGFAQLIDSSSPPLTPTQKANVAQIIQAGWYLLNLVNKVLDLAVIESGKLPVSRERVLLIDVVRECQAMVELKAQNLHIHVALTPFDNTWLVMADPTLLKQVLINLLTNAIKYNREDGTVEISCTASSPERIHISVKDSGVGMSAEKLAHLFEPFNRLGQETGAEEGTGIGLVVSKQLVELMGGSIGVNSIVDVGTDVWFELTRGVSQ